MNHADVNERDAIAQLPITPSDQDSLLGRLRFETRALHERAETLVGLPQDLNSHIRTLATFLGFIEPWEANATASLTEIAGELGDRRKTDLLRNDLHHLGVSDAEVAAMPRCTHLPPLSNISCTLGSMYVFEGATLGGQVLSKYVETHFQLRDGAGYSFYQSYGPDVGVMWKNFRATLLAHTPPDSFDAVVHSACDTFQTFCDWFAQRRAATDQF